MIAEIGHFALILALVVAVVQGTLPMVGAAQGRANWMAVARPSAQLQLLFVLTAFLALMQAYVVSDFSLANVRRTPTRPSRCSTRSPGSGAITRARCCSGS